MLDLILNVAGMLLMFGVACHTIILHRRLTRLRGALAEAGTVLPSLDASVGRMSQVVDGFAQRLQTDLTAVETRLATARRVAAELASVNRSAEEASTYLDRLLRQHLSKDLLRRALGDLAFKHALAAEAVALDPPETGRHQLICPPIVGLSTLEISDRCILNGESRLDTVGVREVSERLLVQSDRLQ